MLRVAVKADDGQLDELAGLRQDVVVVRRKHGVHTFAGDAVAVDMSLRAGADVGDGRHLLAPQRRIAGELTVDGRVVIQIQLHQIVAVAAQADHIAERAVVRLGGLRRVGPDQLALDLAVLRRLECVGIDGVDLFAIMNDQLFLVIGTRNVAAAGLGNGRPAFRMVRLKVRPVGAAVRVGHKAAEGHVRELLDRDLDGSGRLLVGIGGRSDRRRTDAGRSDLAVRDGCDICIAGRPCDGLVVYEPREHLGLHREGSALIERALVLCERDVDVRVLADRDGLGRNGVERGHTVIENAVMGLVRQRTLAGLGVDDIQLVADRGGASGVQAGSEVEHILVMIVGQAGKAASIAAAVDLAARLVVDRREGADLAVHDLFQRPAVEICAGRGGGVVDAVEVAAIVDR